MTQKISGLYKGVISNLPEIREKKIELELRVDIDGIHAMNAISGDFFEITNNSRKYQGSFIFKGIKKIKTPTYRIILIGDKGKFSSDTNQFTDIKISISTNSHPLKCNFNGIDNSKLKLQCPCKYTSKYFRTVYLEHDYEDGVMQLEPLDSTKFADHSSHRSHPITIFDAFAEAGIEIKVVKEKKDSVPSPKGTPISKAVWTKKELDKAMLKHFTLISDKPQWKLWLLSANEYVMSNIYGITIKPKDKKSRGCAVFQSSTGWQSDEEKRFRLFVYIHELGHCFNLRHPWDKLPTKTTSDESQYSTLSWMNLPWRYYVSAESRGGEAFWKSFDFKFSYSELMHLRHGFRNDIIFGGNT